jgi:LuxR family maltose regulon positive regulatory protein
MALSVVDRFCQPLCEAIIDGVSFEQVVNSPLGSGLLQRLEGREHWYRFHPLIREFLLGQLKERSFSQQLSFHRKAAEWFEQQGFVLEAVHHFTQSGDQDEIFDLLDKYATQMLEQGQLQLLLSLVDRLPEAQIKSCHKILLPLAWSKLLVHELADVPTLLGHIEPLLVDPANDQQSRIISEIGIIKASSLVYCDDFEGCEAQLDQFLELLTPEQSFVKALGLNVRSLCYLNKYQFDEFYQAQQQVFGFKAQLTSYEVFIYTHLFTGLAAFEQGRLSQVISAVTAIENVPITNHENAKEILALGKLLQAIYLHQTGDVVGALKMIDANVLAMNHYAFVDLLLKLTIAKGRSLQQQGLLQQAVTFYLQINDIAKSRQSLRLQACVLHELVRMHLNNKNQAAAKKLLKQWSHGHSAIEAQTGPLAQTWEWLELANIRLALQLEKYHGIASQLDGLNTRFSAQGRLYNQLEVLLLITTLHHQQKNAELAQQTLSEALAIDPEHVWLQPFVEQGSALLPCYRQFLRGEHPPLQIGLCQSAIKHLVATVDHIPQVSNNTPPEMALIDPITPKELRVLNLVAQGLSNREVADKQSVSTETVKSHLKSIYSKMGVNRRTQAVNLARDLNLLDS